MLIYDPLLLSHVLIKGRVIYMFFSWYNIFIAAMRSFFFILVYYYDYHYQLVNETLYIYI